MSSHRTVRGAALVGLLLFASTPALAHVKWFSQSARLPDNPLSLAEILTPTFWALTALSVVVVIGLSLLDGPLQRLGAYKRLRDFLKSREDHAGVVMRVASGMSLLLSWEAGVLLAPDLPHNLAVVSWLQFIAILCLIDRRSAPVSGGLIALLYVIGVQQFGLFHMLDYAAFVGVASYLLFREHASERLRAWVKPLLYGTAGLSLAWLALEKLVYPMWALLLLEQNPVLGLNLPPKFFLTAAAFVEFSLGFLLIIGVLGRPLSLVITLVFFLTTMVFGKHEIVGHLILHGVLIVFMLEGTSGALRPPFRLHQAVPLRIAFVGVNFVLLLAGLLVGYQKLASPRTVDPLVDHSTSADHPGAALAIPAEKAPRVTLTATRADGGSWTLEIATERFRLSPLGPKLTGAASSTGEGHAHLFIDGQLRGMIFATPHQLPSLTPGEHTITVQLSTPDHQTLLVNGAPVEGQIRVVEPAEGTSGS